MYGVGPEALGCPSLVKPSWNSHFVDQIQLNPNKSNVNTGMVMWRV